MLKNYSPKQLLLAAITAFIALFNLFTPIFHVVGVDFAFLGTWSANGYQIPFGAAGDLYELAFNDSYAWFMLCGWLHLLLTVAIIALLVYVFVKRPADMAKTSVAVVIASAALSLLYLINGIVSLNTVGDGAYTAAFVPFIIVAVLAAGYVVCEKLLPENLKK